MSDPTRCPHCGVALGEMDGAYEIELDTEDEHTVKACRDYLVAEVERARGTLTEISEKTNDPWAARLARTGEGRATEAERALDHFLSGAPMKDFEG